jgi:butyrate kinase
MTALDRAVNAAAYIIRKKSMTFPEAVRSASTSEGVDFKDVCHKLNERAAAHRVAQRLKAQRDKAKPVSEPAVSYWWNT